MTQDPVDHTPETFIAWFREMLDRRGYTERGAQRRFARDADMSEPTISRLLNGSGNPDPRTLGALSKALNVPFPELLVRACVVTQKDLDALRHVAPEALTTEQAAAELGITSPDGIAAFTRTVRGLVATEPNQPQRPTSRARNSG
ncbi:helix-turn-helix domain-containing protein [Streptomyces sp. 4.24]|uniref:helix-turn-helix domain-containing protein n=1 Tax=Streptomyces tritrimontium TaxID=3406573 RepID=UPI003BB74AB9